MGVYVFTKKGFRKRQSEKLRGVNERAAILISCDLNGDQKMGLLHSQKDYTLLPTYLEILFNLDAQTETWEISVVAFKDWFRKTFGVNNRFNIEERLEWLSNNGLIEFKRVSNDVLTASKHDPNETLTHKVLPLEQAETPAPVISINNQPTQPKQGGSELPPPANQNLMTEYQPILTFINSTTKETVTEVDWIFRGVIQSIKSQPRARINTLGSTLGEFAGQNPDGKKMIYSWLKHPHEVRMAAAGYAIKQSSVASEFDYALRAIDGKWEGYLKLIPATRKLIEANDYTLEV